MAPRSEKLNEQLRADATRKILDAATELFSVRGFHGTSVSEIAARANVSKGLTYHYFRTKEDLLERIIERRVSEVLQMVESLNQVSGPEEKLEHLVEASLSDVQKNSDLYRLYLTLFLQPGASDAIRNIGSRLAKPMEKIFRFQFGIFKDLKFKRPEIEAVLFRSTLQGIIAEYVMQPDLYPMDAVRKQVIDRYLDRH